jgi:hypothetical protein
MMLAKQLFFLISLPVPPYKEVNFKTTNLIFCFCFLQPSSFYETNFDLLECLFYFMGQIFAWL